MAMSDGTAELYELADHVSFDTELKRVLTGKRLHDLADQWKAEREQAAADRAALERARALLAEAEALRKTRYETPDDDEFWRRVSAALGGAR